MQRFETPLLHYATRLLAGDVELARDVVQDTFLRLWQVEPGSVDAHLAQWLYRVCRNRALDLRRKEQRMTALDIDVADDRTTTHPHTSPTHIASDDTNSQPLGPVMQAMQELSDKQQEVIRLKFQGGLSYSEIASVMEITVNHVGVLIHTAIKNIRAQLAIAGQSGPSVHAGPAGDSLNLSTPHTSLNSKGVTR
jgi:RNA polymerase sigma factor (sigma-70 family)